MFDIKKFDIRRIPDSQRGHGFDIYFAPNERRQPYNRCVRPLQPLFELSETTKKVGTAPESGEE